MNLLESAKQKKTVSYPQLEYTGISDKNKIQILRDKSVLRYNKVTICTALRGVRATFPWLKAIENSSTVSENLLSFVD